jgi:hypothetical protein
MNRKIKQTQIPCLFTIAHYGNMLDDWAALEWRGMMEGWGYAHSELFAPDKNVSKSTARRLISDGILLLWF